MPKKFIYMSSRWIDTICVVLIFEILSSFFLGSAGLRLNVAFDTELEANAERRLTTRQSGRQNERMVRRGLYLLLQHALCQSVNLKRATGCLKST